LDHVLATFDRARSTAERIELKLSVAPQQTYDFPDTEIGQQLEMAARMLDAGIIVPSIKVTQGGYDTHANQPDEHARLLGDLDEAIAAYARHARQSNLWRRSVLMTYSEFGRRARENRSAGTDHGTAAPVLLTGGRVRGGFDGQRPSLTALVDDDLTYTTDYRLVYAALARDLWDMRLDGWMEGPTIF
jgi:uncharacterized protein (DUF1501 family)